MAAGWTRRAVVSSLVAFSLQGAKRKARPFPSERFLFADPATETPVVRLTSPEHSSYLPPPPARAIARRGTFLVFWSDRGGSPQAYRMDQASGVFAQLTEAADLDGRSLTLLPEDRAVLYYDGPMLRQLELRKLRERELYRVPEGWRRGPGFALAPDGGRAYWIETRDNASRIRALPLEKHGEPETVADVSGPIGNPLPRPGRQQVLFRDIAGALRLIGRDAPLTAAPGKIGSVCWSPDGGTLLYLDVPAKPGELNAIRELDPESNTDRLVCTTSQYVGFAPNSDASVFVGASGSRAAPYIALTVRATRRELPLCEHRSRDPLLVAPVFAPDNRRVYFHSTRHGKPAIYSVRVERLVEPAEP